MNSEFSFSYTSCLTKAEEPSLPYCLPVAGGRIIGFIPFPRVLVLCEMQLVSSRIWTRVAISISYDDNHLPQAPTLTSYASVSIYQLHTGRMWHKVYVKCKQSSQSFELMFTSYDDNLYTTAHLQQLYRSYLLPELATLAFCKNNLLYVFYRKELLWAFCKNKPL